MMIGKRNSSTASEEGVLRWCQSFGMGVFGVLRGLRGGF